LGICLGMQLAMERSEEGGGVKGLGILEGDVTLLREDGSRDSAGRWSNVGEAYYFAHSYAVNRRERWRAPTGDGGGSSQIISGVQFHPRRVDLPDSSFLTSASPSLNSLPGRRARSRRQGRQLRAAA